MSFAYQINRTVLANIFPNSSNRGNTINGITKAVSLNLDFHGVTVDAYGMTRAGFSASGQFNRSDFGIDFNAPIGLDGMLVSDKVNIELEIQIVPA